MTITVGVGRGSGREGNQRERRGINSFFILLSPFCFVQVLRIKLYVMKEICIQLLNFYQT